jgi:biopolymer transport protein TolQ
MQFLFFGTPAWQLLASSDWMTWCVLGGLFLVSVVCGAIIINKLIQLYTWRNDVHKLAARMHGVRTYEQLVEVAHHYQRNNAHPLLVSIINEVHELSPREKIAESALRGGAICVMTDDDVEHLQMVGDHKAGRMVDEMEAYLPFLGISGAVATLVGLFGTVWGLINALVSIGQEHSADIAVVAPGIAEALVTTLAGLIVAIPAVICFHYFSNEIRKIERVLLEIADRALSCACRMSSRVQRSKVASEEIGVPL